MVNYGQMKQLNKATEQKDREIEDLKNQLEMARAENTKLKKKLGSRRKCNHCGKSSSFKCLDYLGDQLQKKCSELKAKITSTNKYKIQAESLKKTLDRKNREIDNLLKDKKELLDEKESFVDEIIRLKSKINSYEIKMHLIQEPSASVHSEFDRRGSVNEPLFTPSLRNKRFQMFREGGSKVVIEGDMKSSTPRSYSTMQGSNNKTQSIKKNKLTLPEHEIVYNRETQSTNKATNDYSSPALHSRTVQRRSLTPRSFFESSIGFKNKFRRTSSKPIIIEPDSELMTPNDASTNFLSGSHSLIQKTQLS